MKPKLVPSSCVGFRSYHLVGGVVSLELLVGRVLHVNWVVSDDGSDGGVVADHCLCALLAAQFQEGLQGEEEQKNIDLAHAYNKRSLPRP